MSKFDNVLRKISEALPVVPQQQVAGQPPKPATTQPATNSAQPPIIDPAIMKELIAANTDQKVQIALQKLQASQQKPVPGTQPQAAV